jgi:hypothetical protein
MAGWIVMQTLTIEQFAAALDLAVPQARQRIRDGQVVAVRADGGAWVVPADQVQDGGVVKHLPGVITLLRDARFTDDEIVDWLYRADDSLPGTPLDALRANRGTEVKRRAQAAGY